VKTSIDKRQIKKNPESLRSSGSIVLLAAIRLLSVLHASNPW